MVAELDDEAVRDDDAFYRGGIARGLEELQRDSLDLLVVDERRKKLRCGGTGCLDEPERPVLDFPGWLSRGSIEGPAEGVVETDGFDRVVVAGHRRLAFAFPLICADDRHETVHWRLSSLLVGDDHMTVPALRRKSQREPHMPRPSVGSMAA